MRSVGRAAVLGAGVMGAQIAAHLANAGVPTLLFDLSLEAARDGLRRARAMKPDPFFTPGTHSRITPASFDDLGGLRACDWVVEAIVEQLDAKRVLLERVERHIRDSAIVSSNTSGIPLADIAAERSAAFRSRWLGTHFFNPPRYLPLLEVIPTEQTREEVVHAIAAFADHRLGKGVVIAKDTPGFIANRVGVYGAMRVLDAMAGGRYSVEEVDAMTGPAIGRPKSATFRTLDLAGIDVMTHVAKGLAARLPEPERQAFAVPPLLEALITRGWIGAKSGRGFYWKDESGTIQALDPETLTYRPPARPRLPSLEAARAIQDAGERLRALFLGSDRVGEFLRATLAPTLAYAATIAPAVARSDEDVDRAMRWGYGWELGPFESLRAIGIEDVLNALPPSAPGCDRDAVFAHASSSGRPGTKEYGPQVLKRAKAQNRVVKKNAGASLVDLGDGALCVEFHSKMNAIGGDTIQMLEAGLKEAAAGFSALVVGNDAPHFSAGANLMLLLLEAQEGNWDEVDLMVRAFQRATMALKYAPVPVVVAPGGMTLGGGCEIALHGHRVQAAAETYIGLVETGVGLIPAGGGTKEMLARAMDGVPPASDPLPFVRQVFETIAFAKVSTSAPHAREMGYLGESDAITMNRDRLIADAKAIALSRAADYVPATPRTAVRVGGAGLLAALKLGVHLAWRAGRISDHDALIGRKLAWVLAGGNAPAAAVLTEEQLLDLEREAFLSLCGERRTQERIAHTLKTGKPLRN